MKKLVLETTAPFQGLPKLVAYDEGLFAKEGLAVESADREQDVEKKTDINVISPQGSPLHLANMDVRAHAHVAAE
jgi:ABC-type nitrate/sulfonate/bicarbonate transport system substrate-binding protein